MDIDYRAFFLYFFFSLHRYILSYGYAGSLISHLRVNEFPEEIKFQVPEMEQRLGWIGDSLVGRCGGSSVEKGGDSLGGRCGGSSVERGGDSLVGILWLICCEVGRLSGGDMVAHLLRCAAAHYWCRCVGSMVQI